MFDAHAHLQDSRLKQDLHSVLARGIAAEVTGICCCATSPSDWKAVQELEASHSSAKLVILPAYGVHPWYVEELYSDWLELLDYYLDLSLVAPIGEIGLDGIRKSVPRELQKRVLSIQLEMAVRLQRPVILHGARAWGELADIVKPFAGRLPSIIVHGFSGSSDIMRRFVSMGAYISFAGSVCNTAASKVRGAATLVPDGQLLIETDTPDLFPAGGAPAAMDEKNRPLNQPSNLKLICNEVADLRHVSSDVIADITASNARMAFLGAGSNLK
ncbi:MAG: TatD family hydrolase [Kiritimatiellae bacterium]|jgi:TatD DNase family protein|nr:TatD family hydrolase [Kiritimatiellia bacterium]